MPKTLRDCLDLLPKTKGKYFTSAHKENLLARAQQYAQDGHDAQDAGRMALHWMLADTIATHNGLFPISKPSESATSSAQTLESPKPSQTITVSNVQTGTEMPVQPKAGEATPIESVLDRVKDQRAATAPNAESGRGKKAARLFEEMDGKNSADDITELYKDSKADRKVAVLQSPDGSHVVVSSVKKQQKRGQGLTEYGTDAEGKSRPMADLLSEGWNIVGSIKFDEPAKNFAATYSIPEWHKLRDELTGLRVASSRTAEAVTATIAQGREFGRDPTHPTSDVPSGDDVVDAAAHLGDAKTGEDVALADAAAPETHVEVEVSDAIKADASAIFGDLEGKEIESAAEALQEVSSRRGRSAVLSLVRKLIDGGAAPEVAVRAVSNKIYEAHIQSGGSEEGFTKAISASGSGEGLDAAQTVGSKTATEASADNASNQASNPDGRTNDQRGGERSGSPGSSDRSQAGSDSNRQREGGNGDVTLTRYRRKQLTQEEELNAEMRAEQNGLIQGPGWVAPDGEFIEADSSDAVRIAGLQMGGHEQAGLAWLEEHEPKLFAELEAIRKKNGWQDWREADGQEVIKDFMLAKGFVRVAGDSAQMFMEGRPNRTQLNLVKDSAITRGALLTHDLPGGRSRVLFDPAEMERYRKAAAPVPEMRASDNEVAARFRSVIDSARTLGIGADLVKRKVGELVQELGRYQEFHNNQGGLARLITLFMADTNRPGHEDMVSALHEITHALTRDLPAKVQEQLHASVRDATNEMLGIGKDFQSAKEAPTEAIGLEERFTESVAQSMAAKGFNPEQTRGLVQAIWRAFKEVYQRVVMKMADAFGVQISPERARAYMENRLEAGLSGDSAYSLTSWLGGRVVETRDSNRIADDMAASVLYRKKTSNTDDPEFEVSKDKAIDSTTLNMPKVAAQNAKMEVLNTLYKAWDAAGLNPEGKTFAELLTNGNLFNQEIIRPDLIESGNAQLAQSGRPTIDPALKLDGLTNEASKKQAAALGHKALTEQQTWQSNRAREAANRKESNQKAFDRANDTEANVRKSYDSMDTLLGAARDSIKTMAADLNQSLRAGVSEAKKLGKLEQIIRQLDSKMAGELPKPYTEVINALYKKLGTGDGGNEFMDMLDAVSGLEVDWKNDPAQKIRDTINLSNENPLLAPMTKDTPQGKALMALTIAYGKDNSAMMDLLQLRKSKLGDEKIAVNKLLQAAVSDHKDAIATARKAARQLPKLGVLADRLLQQLQEAKDRKSELLAEINRDKEFTDFDKVAAPLLNREMVNLERVFGAVETDWQPVHGAEVIVPKTTSAKLEELNTQKKVLDFNKSTPAEIRGWLKQMSEWVEHEAARVDGKDWQRMTPPEREALTKRIGDGETFGAEWATVQQMRDRLSRHDIEFGLHNQIKGSLANRWMAPLHERLNAIGTTVTRSMSARIAKFDFWKQRFTHEADVHGVKWEASRGEAMKALGIKRADTFAKMIYNASLGFIEKRGDLLPGMTDKAYTDSALKHVMNYLATDPRTAQLMTPKAKAAVEKHLRQTAEVNAWMGKMAKETGSKVLDQRPGYSMFRDMIGGPFTVPRGLNDEMVRTFKAMQPTWGDVDSQGKRRDWTKTGVQDAYQRDPDGLRKQLATNLPPEVWHTFLRHIVERDGRSAFYAPENPDGTHDFAMRERVMKAYESAGGDVVKFAENLFQLEGGAGDPSAFVGETIETLQSFFNNLRDVVKDDEETDQRGLPTPRRYMVDARKSEEMPTPWLDYLEYDRRAMHQITRGQAYNAGFGRNLDAMRADMRAAKLEQKDLLEKWNVLKLAHPTLEGKKLNEAMKATATERGWGDKWLSIKEAKRNGEMLDDVESKFNAFLQLYKTRPPELNPFMEIIGAITAATVSGPATALMDTVAVPAQAFRKFGASTEALHYIVDTAKSGIAQTMGSLLQSVRVQLHWESEWNKLYMAMGGRDPDAMVSATTKFKALMHEPTDANILLKPLVYGSRAMKLALGTGIGKAIPGAESSYATVKPHSAFTWLNQIVHPAAIMGWWKAYKRYTAKAVAHFEANPADLADDKFKFTAKQLGLNEASYRYIANALVQYGVPSMEQLAREAVARRKNNPNAPLLLMDTYRALAAQSQNAITMNSSIMTRAPRLITDWNIANPILGWAIQMGYDSVRSVRNPTGQGGMRQAASALTGMVTGGKYGDTSPDAKKALTGFTTGLMAYAGVLPVGLAYALMRDWYDEHILGRKGNMRDLTTIKSVPDAFLTMIDNTARVGTFGILGDVPNKIFNYDNVKDVSLDNRILFVSSLLSLQKATANWIHQGNADWATVGRPMFQALGGGGYLQYADTINSALGLDNAESRNSQRVSVNNYLRVAGRQLDMNVRTMKGTDSSMPNPTKPYVGQMVMAAYANDAGGFRQAWQSAIAEYVSEGHTKAEALDYVQRAFESYHPLKSVFQTPPSQKDYQKVLASMNDNGRVTVATAVNLINHYGEQVKNAKGAGIAPNVGANVKATASLSLDDLRKRAAGY